MVLVTEELGLRVGVGVRRNERKDLGSDGV